MATTAAPAVRLALLGAVSAAANGITAALLDSPGAPAVAVRIDGADLRVEVRQLGDSGLTVSVLGLGCNNFSAGVGQGDATAIVSPRAAHD